MFVYMYICINKCMPQFTRLEVDISFVKIQKKNKNNYIINVYRLYSCRRGKQKNERN